MNFIHLTSVQNKEFKHLRKLCTQSKARKAEGLIILDGVHLCQEWAGDFEYLVLSETFYDKPEAKKFKSKRCYLISDFLFEKLASTKTPIGIMGVVKKPTPAITSPDRVLLLENIQDPGNLGTIIRTAAAANFDTLFLSSESVDAWSPKVLRAAMGGHFKLQIVQDFDLTNIKSKFDGPIYGTFMGGANIFEVQLPARCGFVLGNEGAGISDKLAKVCDEKISIPMANNVESLNVAMTAGLCMYEHFRQTNL